MRKNYVPLPIDDETLRRLYVDEELSTVKIGRMLGLPTHKIAFELKRRSWLRKQQNGKPTNYKHVDPELLRKLYVDERKSTREIAKIFGISQNRALGKLRELGISRNYYEAKGFEPVSEGHRKKTNDGYWAIYMPNHPNTTASGYILEHRLVMSQHIGRPLTKTEVVHHINEDRLDNRIENLELYKSAGEHTSKEHWKFESKEQMLDLIRKFYKTHGRAPKKKDMSPSNRLASYATYNSHFGTWRHAVELALKGE